MGIHALVEHQKIKARRSTQITPSRINTRRTIVVAITFVAMVAVALVQKLDGNHLAGYTSVRRATLQSPPRRALSSTCDVSKMGPVVRLNKMLESWLLLRVCKTTNSPVFDCFPNNNHNNKQKETVQRWILHSRGDARSYLVRSSTGGAETLCGSHDSIGGGPRSGQGRFAATQKANECHLCHLG